MPLRTIPHLCLLLTLVACSSDEVPSIDAGPACQGLFGAPIAATGLSKEQCAPRCDCGEASFDAPVFDGPGLEALRTKVLVNPPGLLGRDPYPSGNPPDAKTGVCAVLYETGQSTRYRLETFEDPRTAEGAGAILTHHGVCGACSSLADLAVYAGTPDLATPVRACGLKGMTEGDEANLSCLAEIGFSPACAEIWLYNTKNTRKQCLKPCLLLLNSPYHEADGSLNECLRCDEERSGPTFKAIAGRTRRNSGLASALCRPCDSVHAIPHRY